MGPISETVELMNRAAFFDLFGTRRVVIGMVHVQPLPGSPRYAGNREQVFERALADARTLERGGADACIIENFGDAPFYPNRVPAETVAAMAAVAQHIRAHCRVPLGINVLRNDGCAAVAVAAAAGAQFVRVNVLAGAAVADQGILVAGAHEVVRLRRHLDPEIKIFADLRVKHASPLGTTSLPQAARELVDRALADAVIVTGAATGAEPDPEHMSALRRVLADTPLLAGSGMTAANAAAYFRFADGAIVGTSLKRGGCVTGPVDLRKIKSFVKTVKSDKLK